MPSLTLYQANGSCAFIPHALLLHLNIPAKAYQMTIGPEGIEAVDGSISHSEYLKIHPLGYVPALDVDGEVITELPAIVNFINSLAPDENMLGRNGLEQARVMEWLVFLSGTLHGQGFGMLWRPQRFNDDKSTHDGIRAKGRALILRAFDRIETRLKGRDYAVGRSLTAADFALYHFTRWGKEIGIDMADYPIYRKFASRMESVEGIKRAREIEGLEPYWS